ncbi:MAG: histidine phosphatase family protein [Patescibacteria group bacterium]|nr:histidine phosphatase family protein [Patescibacteria group bacterium]
MKTTLLLIRHGEVKNPKNIEYVRLPGFPLSERGKKQILGMAKKIKKKKVEVIYSSPLLRARQSAEIFAKENGIKKSNIYISKKILEANYKKWEGVKRDEREKNVIEGYWNNPVKYSAMLGESVYHIQKRVVDELYKIAETHSGKTIAVFFHADPIGTARLFFEKRPLLQVTDLETKHASVTSIILDDKLKCKKVEYKEYVKADGWRKNEQ